MIPTVKLRKNDSPEFYNEDNYFKGIPMLKKAGVAFEYSETQIEEIYKCMNSLFYMAENYIKVQGQETGQMVPLIYRPYQKEFIKTINENKYTCILSSRQSGKSIGLAGDVVRYITFNKNALVMIIAQKERQAMKLLDDIKKFYRELPLFLQVGVVSWNKKSIHLENGCKVEIEATTPDSARGKTVNYLILDEFAIVPKNIATDFWTAVQPTISSIKDSKVVITTTPRGMNHLYDIWTGAINGTNQFVPLKYTWRDVPGRDEKWKEEQLKGSGMTPALFRQEFEVEFLGSTGTLINGEALSEIEYIEPIKENENTSIYEEPIKDEIYVLTADTSYGVEQDYSTFNIFRINKDKFRQCVVFRSNEMEPDVFATYIYQMAKTYNNAYVICESNDIGLMTINILLRELDYPNLVHIRNRSDRNSGHRLGLRMTQKVKNIGCSLLKDLVENKYLEILDFNTVRELSVFVKRGASYAADAGEHDDIVMSLIIFAYFTSTGYFQEISKLTTSSKLKDKLKKNEDDFRAQMKLFKTAPGTEYDFVKKLL